MDIEKLGASRLLNLIFWLNGVAMESRLRRLIWNPRKMLQSGGVRAGRTVLEVGCGTGFFTLPAAAMVGERGCIIAVDPMSGFVDKVARKVDAAGLQNVTLLRRGALNTGLDASSADVILLFGVLPFPTLPLDRLLPEMHRLLRPDGVLSVWLFPISFGVPGAIARSGLFAPRDKENGVYRFRRSPDSI